MLCPKRWSLEGTPTGRLLVPNQLGNAAGRASDVTEGEELQFMAPMAGETGNSHAHLEQSSSGFIYQSRQDSGSIMGSKVAHP